MSAMGSAPRYLSIRPSVTALPPAPGQSHPFDMRGLLLVYPGKQTSSDPVGIRKSSNA
jgi:hypothetical protein